LQQAIQIPAQGIKRQDQLSITSVLFFSVIQ
jgi:hypothetical protein